MSNKKQTAVEWFFEELQRMQYFIGNDMVQAFQQAKAMEREQIIDFAEKALIQSNGSGKGYPDIELFYKETYDIHREKGED